MKHIILLDPIEKLVIKKDSSLMLALTLKRRGEEVYLLFEEDFYLLNRGEMNFYCFDFNGEFKEDGCYLDSFNVTSGASFTMQKGDIIHMRIDPPFDSRYLRYLWMLSSLKKRGIKIVNDPEGILLFNEKLFAYSDTSAIDSFIGSSPKGFNGFCKTLEEQGFESIILKPLDLYQGIGVEKVSLLREDLIDIFSQKVSQFNGPVIAQPFLKTVEKGEVRSLYFNGVELASILKVPPKGDFLANIARGASFIKHKLSDNQRKICDRLASKLMDHGVPWIAYDLIGESVSEVNITCPGLLVELSFAHQENLAEKMVF